MITFKQFLHEEVDPLNIPYKWKGEKYSTGNLLRKMDKEYPGHHVQITQDKMKLTPKKGKAFEFSVKRKKKHFKIYESFLKLSNPWGEKRKEFVVRDKETGTKIKVRHHTSKNTYVTDLHTPEQSRGKGGANRLMKRIARHLDRTKRTGHLIARAMDDKTSEKKLIDFYKKYGFEMHRPGNQMKREPK